MEWPGCKIKVNKNFRKGTLLFLPIVPGLLTIFTFLLYLVY